MKLSFKTFCACLALLYAGDVVATDSDLSSYNEERGRSNVEVRNKTKSKSLFRSRSSSRDRSVRGEKSVVREMTWEEYKNEHPTGSVLIKDTSLLIDYSNFGDLLLVNERCSFPELTKVNITKDFNDLWTPNHGKALSVLLSRAPNLCKLDLSGTELTELPREIGNLTNLRELNLDVNKNLKKLPREIGNLKNLTKLSLVYTGFIRFPEEICKLENLESLDFSQCDFVRLPNKIGNLKNLVELNLSFCHYLTELPKEIGKLTKLRKFNLCDTGLTELPKEIGKLTNLKELDLSSTGLTDLPRETYNLKNLTLLRVGYSKITELQEKIGNLTNLRELDLSSTGLIRLPKGIENLVRLENLKLFNVGAFDSVADIPDDILNLPNLRLISLSDKEDRYIEYSENDIKNEIEKRIGDPIYKEEIKRIHAAKVEQIRKENEEKDLEEERIRKEIKKPLADWPIVQRFSSGSREEDYYNNETWDKNKTLADNQEELIDKFVEKCCDFSDEEMKKYEDQIVKLFSKIVKDPVGCEFLRLMLAKTVVNNLKKISFIPSDESNAFQRQIKISIKSLKGEGSAYPAATRKFGDVIIQRKIFPPEFSLLHELGHCFRTNSDISESVISKRMAFSPLDSREDEKKIKRAYIAQYSNDEEYHNMFGLTEKGLDLINEASYMAHRYGFIRLWHIDGAQEEIWKSVKKGINLMRKYGVFDRDLYNFYLSPEFKERCPKFGIGDYECRDLDPKTGKKLSTAQHGF